MFSCNWFLSIKLNLRFHNLGGNGDGDDGGNGEDEKLDEMISKLDKEREEDASTDEMFEDDLGNWLHVGTNVLTYNEKII